MTPGPDERQPGEAQHSPVRPVAGMAVAWLVLRIGASVLLVADAVRIAGFHGPNTHDPRLVLWRLSWSARGAGFMAAYALLTVVVVSVVAVVAARPPRFAVRSLGLAPSGLSPPVLVAVLAGAVGVVTVVEACLATLAGTGRFVAFDRMQAIRDADWQTYVWLLVVLPFSAAAVELLLRGVGQAALRRRQSLGYLAALAIVTPFFGPEPFHFLATVALAAYLGWVTSRVRSAGPALGSHALATGVAVLAVQAYPGAVPVSDRVLLFVGGGVLAFIGVEAVRRFALEAHP